MWQGKKRKLTERDVINILYLLILTSCFILLALLATDVIEPFEPGARLQEFSRPTPAVRVEEGSAAERN